MFGQGRTSPADLLRRLRAPVMVLVGVAVASAWYVTWVTAEDVSLLMDPVVSATDPLRLGAFFALMVVMMAAMMLPSALPMIAAYRGMTRLEAGRPTKPVDVASTILFTLPYFLVWGGFAVVALFALMALGLMAPFPGSAALVPAVVLLLAGGYQLSRPKRVCLSHCQSPAGFVLGHWRSGRRGAVRMGLAHAFYCMGCCWLLMIVLFVVGAMSLVWMGVIAIAITAEKVAPREWPVASAIGAVFLIPGVLLALRALLAA